MYAVEQYARAHIVTDTADSPDDERRAVPVALRYDPETDPRQVHITLPGPHEWVFARELLEQGLRVPVSNGDVRVWPCGRVQAVMEFHSAQGVAVVQVDSKALMRFLRRTYTAATPVAH
ncbi:MULTISPECIES: SsgA family sporulation/cell division regulator [unclassified Streptomyces]|uniref:SsgA family sporulation/cell division regulator n=1 Tax=unclassified Streptomyces TaxID=2593676 RepID=UPI002E8078B5|nr:SsgA family sporulation/cell division regulator [Streptomyces sp. NBC_00589]WTI38605.1 SsgA family sporulation/cell division regulator [Streptomyces sp. NBC_00775]WUB27716.1 SsgA family sporulation/cell division regulator [Streptomyces sp. NBC_00589]